MATRPSQQYWERGHAKVHVESKPAPANDDGLYELRTVTLILPMPPSVNEAWHHVAYLHKGKPAIRKALTAEHRAFRSEVDAMAVSALSGASDFIRGSGPIAGRIHLEVLLKFRDRRSTDIDNRIKPLMDALTCAMVWNDDRQVDVIVVRREVKPKIKNELCLVTVTEISP